MTVRSGKAAIAGNPGGYDIVTQPSGTNTATFGANALVPTFASGVAAQLTDLTRDYVVYLEIGTAGTAMSLAIGPTNATAISLLSAAVGTSGQLLTFRLPAGWFAKWTATTATLAAQAAVSC